MEWGGGETSCWGCIRDGGCFSGICSHGRRFLGVSRRSGSHTLRETVSVEMVELSELETQRRNRVDEGGRPEPHTQVQWVCVCASINAQYKLHRSVMLNNVIQDIGAGCGGWEWNQVGGSCRRVEQCQITSMAEIQVVEHQETSS